MILFTILLLTLVTLAALVLTFTGVIGGAALVVFGDVIACVLIIMLLIKAFSKKK